MQTISQLAKKHQISRATILYYEKQQLLVPAFRSDNGYRWYGEKEVNRLAAINAYRSYGLPIASIRTLLSRNAESQASILKQHFNQLDSEIQTLKAQQKAIVLLLQQPNLIEENNVTKERWVNIMKAAGFSENDMRNWHQKFEQMEPQAHQSFLESLGIEQEEIKHIRQL